MRDTFRSWQRKIMCVSVFQPGRLSWRQEGRRCPARARIEGLALLSQRGGHPEDRGRWKDCQRGVTVQREGSSLCQRMLLKLGSLKAAAPAAAWLAAVSSGRIRDPQAGG